MPGTMGTRSGFVASDEAGSFLRLIAGVLRHARVIAIWTLLGVAAAVVWLIVQPRKYTSTGAFVPQNTNAAKSQLSGLAAQFGIMAGGALGEDPPGYYPALLRSRSILRTVAETPLRVTQDGQRRTEPLWTQLRPKGKSVPQKIQSATDTLAKALSVARDKESGIIQYSVRYRDSVLVGIIAQRLLTVLADFNLNKKQSQASAERQFVESRLAEQRAALRAAEDALQYFLQSNREFRNSPPLAFEQDRLQRRVTTLQGIVTTLAESYERARVDEVRNTPLFTVLEEPRMPVKPDPRAVVMTLLYGLALGLGMGMAMAVGREYIRRVRVADPAAYAELAARVPQLVRGGERTLRHP